MIDKNEQLKALANDFVRRWIQGHITALAVFAERDEEGQEERPVEAE